MKLSASVYVTVSACLLLVPIVHLPFYVWPLTKCDEVQGKNYSRAQLATSNRKQNKHDATTTTTTTAALDAGRDDLLA